MGNPNVYRNPIAFAQLCAVAREILESDPTMLDGEWKAAIHEWLARYRFQLPPNDRDLLTRVMDHVHRSIETAHGPRPVPTPGPREAAPEARALNHGEAVAALSQLAARFPQFAAATRAKSMPKAAPLTERQYAKAKALRMVGDAMLESIDRCEALEAKVGDK